tara:strand:+ start:15148 stop:15468 length:321 start_codon:yes stop_codon:yes gene_type:complete
MIGVIYRLHLKPGTEHAYKTCWRLVADYFVAQCGALGSRLHQDKDGWFVIYSNWPDDATRQAAWPGDDAPNEILPNNIRKAIFDMKDYVLEKDDEVVLNVVEDKLQ